MSVSGDLQPMDSLFEIVLGPALPLPDRLARVYGWLEFPPPGERPYFVSSLVSSLGGLVAPGVEDRAGGGEVGGGNSYDRFLLGLLRASADAVIVGAGSLIASPQHQWTPDAIYPELGEEYRQLRARLGKTGQPATVVVTSRGGISLDLPLFHSANVPVLILTTEAGMELLAGQVRPEWVQLVPVKPSGYLLAEDILESLARHQPGNRYIVEGGPRLLGEFFRSRSLDELFLTLSPHIAGGIESSYSPGGISGQIFTPNLPSWGSLYSVKRVDSHIFLRYGFSTAKES